MRGQIIIDLQNTNEEQIAKYEKIFRILINKGALDGVRGGQTVIHWDNEANFKGVSFDYWVYKER